MTIPPETCFWDLYIQMAKYSNSFSFYYMLESHITLLLILIMHDKGLTPLELDNLINKLVNEKKGNDVKMAESDVRMVCQSVRTIFL